MLLQTRPRVFRILLTVLGHLLIAAYAGVIAILMWYVSLPLFFFVLAMFGPTLIVSTYIQSNKINYAKATQQGLRIVYPFQLKSDFYEWSELKGYSKSDYYYGGKITFSSLSIVIYPRNGKPVELLKHYQNDFKEFQTKIRKFEIVCFGSESFKRTGHFLPKRVYKYENMFN